MSKPKVISLCGGAGISEYGVKAFFDTVLMVEIVWRACCSFLANHPGVRVVCGDVCSKSLIRWARRTFGTVDGIIGTFPCPSFSKAGNQDPNDPRSAVLLSILDWVEAFRPRFVLLENVPDLLDFPHFWIIYHGLRRMGYDLRVWHLDAMDYGTAHRRPRLFVVAVRHGERAPLAPEPAHGAGRLPYRTIKDAIGDMTASERMRLDGDWLSLKRAAIMEPVPDGGNWRCLTGWRRRFVINSAAKVGHKPQQRTARRYHELDVADTVMTGVQIKKVTLPLPPRSIVKENRPFSVAEVQRLMDVDDGCSLHGTKAQRYLFTGNGVPVRLMRAVCGAVAKIFEDPSSDSGEPTKAAACGLHEAGGAILCPKDTSGGDLFSTPQYAYLAVHAIVGFTVDVASLHENAKCARHYTPAENGLLQSWKGEKVWCNPPYSEILPWVLKAAREQALTAMLLPATPDTRWFAEIWRSAFEIWFVKGRLQFGGSKCSGRNGSMIVFFAPGRSGPPVVRQVEISKDGTVAFLPPDPQPPFSLSDIHLSSRDEE